MLCTDGAADASCVAINAVSAALLGSSIPWNGPLAAVQVAVADQDSGPGPTVVQPSAAQLAKSSMAGLYVGTASNTLLADFQVGEVLHEIAAQLNLAAAHQHLLAAIPLYCMCHSVVA